MAPEKGEQPSDDGSSGTDSPPGDDGLSHLSPGDRAKPLVSSLCAGLLSDDDSMAQQAGTALAVVANRQPDKVSAIIGRLVELVVEHPQSEPIVRTLATVRPEHGREIRGALMTETGYSTARRIYGRIEHAEPWELDDVAVERPEDEDDPSFVSRVMRLIELENEGGDPLDSEAWVHLIEQLLGDGGESASKEALEQAAGRQPSRPRTVRRRHRRIEQVANSRTFRAIEAHSRFDELEVLSPIHKQRFGKVIRTRGLLDGEEHAITIRLPHRLEREGFRARLAEYLGEWSDHDDESIVTVLDWGEAPQPWLATEFVESTLASHDRLSPPEALEHARTLTRALVLLHQNGIVHGGIDPSTVGYPPNTLDGVVEPMLDHVGMIPAYREFVETDRFLDIRYAAPEFFDDQYGQIDRATDIYGLGMVLYRALTGDHPFDGEPATVREQIRSQHSPPPTAKRPDLPDGLDEILAKATATEKLVRYENATRFHQEIRQICDDER